MAKYKVEVGGFVSTFRKRNITVYADTEDEAKEKAVGKFMDLQQANGYSMCDDGTVDSIERLN